MGENNFAFCQAPGCISRYLCFQPCKLCLSLMVSSHAVRSWNWSSCALFRGPDGVKLENANSSIATVTGLQVGTYEFTLTVKDERNLQSQSSVNVIVKEGRSSHTQNYLGPRLSLSNWARGKLRRNGRRVMSRALKLPVLSDVCPFLEEWCCSLIPTVPNGTSLHQL